jgi:1,4-alpha-glucan branching enzyme
VQQDYRLGVPKAGVYREVLNTDSAQYGGSNVAATPGTAMSEASPWHDKPHSITLTLPPLSTVFLTWNN